MPERFVYTLVQKRRYLNTLPLPFVLMFGGNWYYFVRGVSTENAW